MLSSANSFVKDELLGAKLLSSSIKIEDDLKQNLNRTEYKLVPLQNMNCEQFARKEVAQFSTEESILSLVRLDITNFPGQTGL